MTLIEVAVECPVFDSFRVQQVAGLFDTPLAERAKSSFAVDVPTLDEDWLIGLIVGPSGSGKSTIARQAFSPWLATPKPWPAEQAVIDGFGEMPTRAITDLLTSVGFGSPPAWVKPYAVLSGGERFRCDLARALALPSRAGSRLPPVGAESSEKEKTQLRAEVGPTTLGPDLAARPLVVFDEFTSVVDRQVAQFGSAAIAKAIRSGRLPRRFVAVSCHYDVREWLEPDWVVDMATRTCQRRRLRRPAIELEIYRCRHSLWPLFAPHHYLSGSLSKAARAHVALWRGTPVCFCATLPVIGRRGRWRISRLVTLPDYQGIGVGMRVAEAVAAEHVAAGQRLSITASHPAVIAHCRRSHGWRAVNVKRLGSGRAGFATGYRGSSGRSVVSFEYLGPAAKFAN
jgi:GNAT superfamily N-acetyltransferase